MKKIKHSKFKNTGFLFELLTRQITLEVINGSEEKAKKIMAEFYGKGSELSKELRLFNLLINEKYSSDIKAEKFINAILEAHGKLEYKKLQREKYNLIKSIKENFEISNFLSSPVTNYKVLASIHKIFEAKKLDVQNVKDVFNAKQTLVEHISLSSNTKNTTNSKQDKLVEEYKAKDKDLRLLAYKILVETFNKKYSNLNKEQKSLLREYINNISNTTKFNEYFESQLIKTITSLHEMYKGMKDKITKIKLKETINVLKKQKIGKKITDGQVSALMMSYELIKEINNVNGKKS
tara:strand:- start:987 stop:1865 length:879 start_codon:yes stop_codon:yes gene_type:complete